MKRLWLTLMTCLIFIGGTVAYSFELHITDDKLSIHADQIPLQEILHRLTDWGVRIHADPQLNPKISASFENRDIQKGLESVLKPLNHVLIWEAVAGTSGKIFKLASVQIFEPGKKDRMKILERRKQFDIVRNPSDGSLYVNHEILLRLKSGVDIDRFKRLLKKIGATITDSKPGLRIYKIRLPENISVPRLAELINQHANIGRAEPNYAYPIIKPIDIKEGGINTDGTSEYFHVSLPDAKVPIAVLDSGFMPGSGADALIVASLDAVEESNILSDSNGHGTQMTLIASGVLKPYGVSSETESLNPVIPIRAMDDNGHTTNFTIMDSIDFALEKGARVMSLSWGSETHSEFLEDAMDYAKSEGLIIFGGAGNKPTGKPFYPAAYPSVIGVGALGADGNRWESSNYGDFVSLYAPGVAIVPDDAEGTPRVYSGTSISTAYTANQAAAYLVNHPNASARQVLNSLKRP